jgi:hypothetical protein
MPIRLDIQSAVTQILSAYLETHHLRNDQIPSLLAAVGQALSDSLIPTPEPPQPKTRRGPDRPRACGDRGL